MIAPQEQTTPIEQLIEATKSFARINLEKLDDITLAAIFNTHDFLQDSMVRTVRIYTIFQEAVNIINRTKPADFYTANTRNLQTAREYTFPINRNTRFHGLPLEHLKNSQVALLAGDFHGGGQENAHLMTFYLSEITDRLDLNGKNLKQIIEATPTRKFGLKPGRVTLLIQPDKELNERINTSWKGFPAPDGTGIENGLPIGIESHHISGCVVSNPEDEASTLGIIKDFPFYIPVYNSENQLLNPPPQTYVNLTQFTQH